MNYFLFLKNRPLIATLLSLSLLAIAACNQQPSQSPAPAALDSTQQEPIVPTPADTPEPSVNEPVGNGDAVGRDPLADLSLTAWVLPQLDTDTDTPAGNIISQQLSAFDTNHPEIQLNVEHKSIVGQGSMFEYFSVAKTVAPSILPDLILVPHTLLPQLALDGVIYPVDELVPAEDLDDLFPVANDLVTIDGLRYGYPYALSGLTHAAYNTAVITSTFPARLDRITDSGIRPAFPAADAEGAQLLLQIYINEGGQLYDAEGNITFEATPLLVALRRIQELRANGAITDGVGAITSEDELWQLYKAGSHNLILTSHQRFLTESRTTADLGFAQFPGTLSGIAPMVDGWVWAISTADPVRQALAIELLSWMANGPNMGDWTFASQMLPARRTAINRWPPDAYTQFLNSELERAMPEPDLLSSPTSNILVGSMQALFSAADPPVQDIAENAVTVINGN